ncbi:hypothetical protein M066_0234 [Bacteroides fragilis str. I1345]|nr:hypothetical protein M066_0234 [Bacteroides fragilis str. I1345]
MMSLSSEPDCSCRLNWAGIKTLPFASAFASIFPKKRIISPYYNKRP